MKKFLLLLLIFTPWSSISAYDCEIELHTGALWRGGTYVFPKGVQVQNFSLRYDTNDDFKERDVCPNYSDGLNNTFGKRWEYGVKRGIIKIIGNSCNKENTRKYDLVTRTAIFTLKPTSISHDRMVEYYPIDYGNASLYLSSVQNTSSGLVFPKIFAFSSLIALDYGFEGNASEYKICVLDQQKLAQIGGFTLESPGKSYVLVPYSTLEIPKEYSGEDLWMRNQSFDVIKEYSEPYFQDGKPVLPIEYK